MARRWLAWGLVGVVALAAIAALASFVVSPTPPAPSPTPEPTVRPGPWSYVALGDSLAAGAGGFGYVPRYAEALQEDTGVEVEVTNLGVSGWTAPQLLTALRERSEFRDAVAGADVLTWDIGGNDLYPARALYKQGLCGGEDNEECLRQAVERFRISWNEVLDEIVLGAPDGAALRTMTYYNPFVGQDLEDGSLDTYLPYLEAVNDHITETATRRGALVAGVFEAFNGPDGREDPREKGWISPDGLHPDGDGYAVIARLFGELGYAPLVPS